MKIKEIKKKLKSQKTTSLTMKEGRWFHKVLRYSTSIRNTVIRGMLIDQDYSGAMQLLVKYDKRYQNGWTLIKE